MEILASGISTTPHCKQYYALRWVTDWRILIFTLESDLSREAKREAVKPDEEVRKERPPTWHIPFLHNSDFMALSHTELLQAQTAGYISVHYRHLHMSQALLGWGFMQEIGSFRILSLLYISLLRRWMTALKPLFLVINYEGSVGISTEIQTPSAQFQHSWLKSSDITEKFLWISGKSGFHFVSFLITTIFLFSKNKMLSSSEGQPKLWSFLGWVVRQMKRETKQTRGEKVGNLKH